MLKENQLYLGDSADLLEEIPDHSVDLIVTDPPYIKTEWVKAYAILATHAPRILKPSGWLICYSGHFSLNHIMRMFDDCGLKYYWTIAQLNEGQTAMVHARRVFAKWKPILVYQAEPFHINDQTFYDCLHSQREKAEHEWQQSTGDLEQIIPRFSHPGELLVEPFLGSGTTITVAKRYGLRYIGCEIDPKTYQVAVCRQIRESLFSEF